MMIQKRKLKSRPLEIEPKRRRRSEQHDAARVSITDLPIQILMEILSRLSVLSIFRCRSLCKLLLRILVSNDFAEFHFARAPTCPLLRNLNAPSISSFVYLVEVERDRLCRICDDLTRISTKICANSCVLHDYEDHVNMKLSSRFMLPDIPENPAIEINKRRVDVVNSCNGFLCLCGSSSEKSLGVVRYAIKKKHDSIIIYNPVTGEYSSIPLPQFDQLTRIVYIACLGLGFCPDTKEYKVLIMVCKRTFNLTTTVPCKSTIAMIYTLGSGLWRNIGKLPDLLRETFVPIYLNGALHWYLGDDFGQNTMIICFNLKGKKFQILPPHNHARNTFGVINFDEDVESVNAKFEWYFGSNYNQSIGVLRDHLFICEAYCHFPIRMWVMKDYGVKESWFKESIYTYKKHGWPGGLYLPIDYLKNGDLLMYYENNGLIFYDGCNIRISQLCGFKSKFDAIAHVPSFLSLKEIVGDNLEILNVRSRLTRNASQVGKIKPLYLVEEDMDFSSDYHSSDDVISEEYTLLTC